jgi:hypothetical protein
MRHEEGMDARWRPVAYIAVDDPACRAGIGEALQRLGWCVIEQPTGFHVLGAIADVIERDGTGTRPGLIVVDEISRGCSGATLARGLQDLGCAIPIVLVRDPWMPASRASYGTGVHVVDRGSAPRAVDAIARPWSPISLMQPIWSRERAMA